MTAVTYPYQSAAHDKIRSINIYRDLSAVADLIELCFVNTLDDEGKGYIRQMRRASRDSRFLRWATRMVDSVSLPLTGYVWEDGGKIVGNVSIIPFRRKKQLVFLLANVAVHPDFRRQGIARALTLKAMENIKQRRADEVWLHVRDDNESAVRLYESLSFREKARRTTWIAHSNLNFIDSNPSLKISSVKPSDWPLQRAWLKSLYPKSLSWYHSVPWKTLRPGIVGILYRIMGSTDVQQWAGRRNGKLSVVLSWERTQGYADYLWLAAPSQSDPYVTDILNHARKKLAYRRTLALEFPAGRAGDAIQAAGFVPQRTLIWMRAENSLQLEA